MPDDSTPKPGHFLPGGAGDVPKGDTAPLSETLKPSAPRTGAQKPADPTAAGTAPLAAPTPRLGATAQPGPPQLSGSRLGPPPPGDPAATAFKARYAPDPIPYVPRKRSKALIAGIVAGVLVLAGGAVAGSVKLLSSVDDFVANPMGTPSVRPTTAPTSGAEPTDSEPTATPTPDLVVLKENKLYSTGRLAPVACKEPQQRPTTKDNIHAYYEALLVCLNKAWEPVVRKAGYEFRAPKLLILDEGQETACGLQDDTSGFCDTNGGQLEMSWQRLVDDYGKNRLHTRISMADNLGYVYGHHVQHLTGILAASHNRRDEAPNKAAELEETRRFALQAACLSAVFYGSVKATFPLQGKLLENWNHIVRNSGDENSVDKVRDHGSRKSVELWMTRGFGTPDPSSCNTFVAAANKVG